MSQSFIEVIVPVPLPRLFTYSVGEEWMHQVGIGKRVLVPFGNQKIYAAVINNINAVAPEGYVAKAIISVLDDVPVVTEKQLALWQWIQKYYLCNLGDVMHAALPAALKLNSETKIVLNPEAELPNIVLTDDEFLVMEALHSVKSLTLKEISKILDRKYVFPVVKSLMRKNITLSVEDVKEDFKIPLVHYVKLSAATADADFLKKEFDKLEKKAPKQLDVMMQQMMLSPHFPDGKVPQRELLKKSGGNTTTLQQLVKKNLLIITLEKEIGHRTDSKTDFYVLNAAQQDALNQIQEGFTSKKVGLLHGVTSSGKTEIYIRLIDDCLKKGKQALYLLPEIALTTQMIHRLEKHFGKSLLVYHSRFNDNERATTWTKLIEASSNEEPFLVLGARSAVFLPFSNLGLVIVDEEHEPSYKQFDPAPRYHARDTAIVLASLYDADVLLGSATPSIESYYNARRGKYFLTELFARHADIAPPLIQLVNIKELTLRRQMKSHFSPLLIQSMEAELNKGKQIILFQNRRGYAPVIQCHHCNWIPHCNNCDVALTYYKRADILRCHYCGYTAQIPLKCPSCGETDLRQHGFGTEKIEDELQIFFPEKKIARLDLDSTRGKHSYKEIIYRFETRETDILVGTQMVTKGLDFDNVSLVGILNADSLINFPDFRAYERSFQMLQQVSGRAGRKNEQGKVIIQSYNPSHTILQFVVNNDYKAFIDFELAERQKFHYPPYYRLTEITLKGKQPDRTDEAAKILSMELKKYFPDTMGPVSPVVSRIKNYYLRTIMVKNSKKISASETRAAMLAAFEKYRLHEKSKNILVHIDVDPV